MAIDANVTKIYFENGCICLEAAIDEGDKDKNGKQMFHVYTGRLPYDPVWDTLTENQQLLLLKAAVKAVRAAQQPAVPALPVAPATVTV